MIHVPTLGIIAEDRPECVEPRPVVCAADQLKTPVAYEEVTLTEEAAEILEKERKAAAERPARKIRRVADAH